MGRGRAWRDTRKGSPWWWGKEAGTKTLAKSVLSGGKAKQGDGREHGQWWVVGMPPGGALSRREGCRLTVFRSPHRRAFFLFFKVCDLMSF